MINDPTGPPRSLEEAIKQEARRLGFILAGVTTPDPPPHNTSFEAWLAAGRHGSMAYLSTDRSRACRADPRQLLADCESILVLAAPYSNPKPAESAARGPRARGRIAAYAWGEDYHRVLPARMRALVSFIEGLVGHSVSNRCLTDSAPVLERDLAQRAGLGWIGKNTCLIHPRMGSYILLAEILLALRLEPDRAVTTDHCGTCTRCIDACPTGCILTDRTLDARKCISYLTIELRPPMPETLRRSTGDWIFGCDVCQIVCPWNRFAPPAGDAALSSREDLSLPLLEAELELSAKQFEDKYTGTPIKRSRYAGFMRNLAVAVGNRCDAEAVPMLKAAARRGVPGLGEHCDWAIAEIEKRIRGQ